MSTVISCDEAIAELEKLTSSGKYSIKDLMALGGRVSVEAAKDMTQGSVTLLYSGTVNGVGSGTLIADMLKASAGNEIRVIDKTQTGAFLNSPEFKTAFADLKASMTPAKGKVTMIFITHQVPKGLQVDEVVNMGQHATSMHVVSTAS